MEEKVKEALAEGRWLDNQHLAAACGVSPTHGTYTRTVKDMVTTTQLLKQMVTVPGKQGQHAEDKLYVRYLRLDNVGNRQERDTAPVQVD